MAYREEFSPAAESGPSVMEGKALKPSITPTAEMPQEKLVEPPAPAKRGFRGRIGKKTVLFILLAIALVVGLYEGARWWTTGRFMVSTDDAYVQADITILSAKVSGYVATVAVNNNQSVKAGDLIARIDNGDYQLALQSAKGKLMTQRSTIARIDRQIEAGRAAVPQAEAQILAAQADAERAQADYDRQLQLSQSNYASRATLETAKAEKDRSQANVQIAQAGLTAAQENVQVLIAQKAEAEGTANGFQIAVEQAQRDLSFTEIRAPIDGVIGNKSVEVGTYVQPGARLSALVPLNSVHVDANFKETQLASLKPGQKVHIKVDAFPDHDVIGTLESVSPASGSVFSLLPPENATGNFTKIVQRVPVRVAVDPDVARQGLLRPGMSVVATVDTREDAADKTVP